MRETDGARAATAEHPATPSVAPRFTRAAETERSRLEGKREQLLRKRAAVQAELGEIDRAVGAVGELLELLAPLLPPTAANLGRPATTAGRRPSAAQQRRNTARRMSAIPPSAEVRDALHHRSIVADPGGPNGRPPGGAAELADALGGATNQRQPTKEQSR